MSARFSLHVMALAYSLGELDIPTQDAFLGEMVAATEPEIRQSVIDLANGVRALRNDDAWKRALRTMRKYR